MRDGYPVFTYEEEFMWLCMTVIDFPELRDLVDSQTRGYRSGLFKRAILDVVRFVEFIINNDHSR